MEDLSIAAIRRRFQTKITDLGETNSKLIPADPVTIANDQRQLGFSLPPLMTRIYAESAMVVLTWLRIDRF
jgi:hypothetical protein